MKLSRANSYAVHALVHMAGQPPGEPVASYLTAAARGVSEHYLLQLFRRLTRAGIVRAVGGPGGGFRLARPAQDITLLDVIEAVDGPIRGDVPDVGQGAAALARQLRQMCDEAAALARQRLARVTLAELARGK
jgi:Rrf2 family protein